MNIRKPDKLARIFIILIIIILGGKEIYYSQKYSDRPSKIADAVTEVVTLRGGECFAQNGFLSNAGLADYWCNKCKQFTEYKPCETEFIEGKVKKEDLPPDTAPWLMKLVEGKYIRTHYPPGPHWLAGIYTKICGLGNLGCFRLFPTIFGISFLILFTRILLSVLDSVKSAMLIFALAIIPTTSNTMHGLSFEAYTLPLFLIQLGFYIVIFKKKIMPKMMHLSILFLLGFIQGWLTFDFIILVSLSALPLSLLYSSLEHKEDRKRLILAILAPSFGFFFAQFLHFMQVVIFYGSLETALKDVFVILANRANNPNIVHISRTDIVINYFFRYARDSKFFIINFPIFLIGVLILLWIKEARINIQKPFQLSLKWISSWKNYLVIMSALFVSCLLMFIMKDQFNAHPHILPRHLFLLYFVCILTMLECINSYEFNIKILQEGKT